MSPKHHLCSAWCIHIAPCLVKKIKLYGRFLYFGLCSPVSNLWNICLINTSIFWWTNFWELDRNIQVKILCVSHNGKRRQWSLHDILRCLGCSEQIQPSLQRVSLEESQHPVWRKRMKETFQKEAVQKITVGEFWNRGSSWDRARLRGVQSS